MKMTIIIHSSEEEQEELSKCLKEINYINSQKMYSILKDAYEDGRINITNEP